MRRSRRLGSWLLYGTYLAAIVTAVDYVAYRRYVGTLRSPVEQAARERPAAIDALTASRLGALKEGRPGSFARVAVAKPAGAVRIGCFGDSFTYGLEVDAGREYPRVLQELFHAHGHPEVEVINFGNPGFGFHQTYLMWELVGARYALDASVLLVFPGMWHTRDATFTFWDLPAAFLGFHARYVLDGPSLALIDVVGDTEPERFKAYTRFLPPLRYLRYDRRPPALLRAWLPERRTIENPFYYTSLPGPIEMSETYRRLLARLMASGQPVILADPRDEAGSLVTPQGRFQRLPEPIPVRFPYAAVAGHYSPWGHRLLAEQVGRTFGLDVQKPIDVLETHDPGPAVVTSLQPADVEERVRVEVEGRPVGSLYLMRPGAVDPPPPTTHLPPDHRYLLAVPLSTGVAADGVFLPLRDDPTGQLVVVERDGQRTTLPVRAAGLGGSAVARLDLCAAETWAPVAEMTRVECTVPLPWGETPTPAEFTVRVGDVAIAGMTFAPFRAVLRPMGPYYRVAADSGGSGTLDGLGDRGVANLVFERAGEPARHAPIAAWTRTRRVYVPRTAPVRLPR